MNDDQPDLAARKPDGQDLVDNAEKGRFELYRDESLAGWLYYSHLKPNRYVLRHTEVDPAHQGKGLAAVMVTRVLEDVRSRGATITAICPFVVDFLSRTPSYADLVDPRHPGYADRGSAEASLARACD